MRDESFKEFVLDQLSTLPELRAKAMFGGHGLYQGNDFFGILFEGRLYFKTDNQSQKDFTERGMGPFTYEQRGRRMTMQYYEVPASILEDREALAIWANRAVQIATSGGRKPMKQA
jgi:DNA transformation protein and related proteins